MFASTEHFYDGSQIGPGRTSRWFAWIIRFVGWIVVHIFFRVRTEGMENLKQADEGQGFILAGNHMSMIDPLFPWVLLRSNIRFLAKEELYHNKLLGQMLARIGAIPLARGSADRTAIKRCAAALKRGENVGIFPEGHRRRSPDQVMEFHAGVVLIANMGNAPIIPMGIQGTENIKPDGKKLLRFPKVTIRFGKPLYPKDYDYLPKKGRAQAITDELMRQCYALRDGQQPVCELAPAAAEAALPDGGQSQEEAER